MIKIIQLFIFLSTSIPSFAQSFIDSTKVWNVAQCGWSMGQICYTFSFKFSGDTVINSITYQKLMNKQDSTLSNWSFHSSMRETGNKVYTYQPTGEILSYDFGANVGDTIHAYVNLLAQPMIVDSIDTVLVIGIPKRRFLFFSSFWNYETWIEDIGSLNGIANPLTIYGELITDYSELTLCYHENNSLIYMDTTVNSCFIATNIKEYENLFFKMYPNPANNFLNIEFKMNSTSDINIVIGNYTGQIVQVTHSQKLVYGENKISIPVSDLPSGIYFIKLYIEDKLITKKFIKN